MSGEVRRGMSGLDVAGVVAGVVAVVILLDVSVLWILGRPVPELLGYLATSIFGFYFGRDRGTAARGTAAREPRAGSGGVVGVPPAAGERLERVTGEQAAARTGVH